jgi:hypothetical protein
VFSRIWKITLFCIICETLWGVVLFVFKYDGPIMLLEFILFFVIPPIIYIWIHASTLKLKDFFVISLFISIMGDILFSVLGYLVFPGFLKDEILFSSEHITNMVTIFLLLLTFSFLGLLIIWGLKKIFS